VALDGIVPVISHAALPPASRNALDVVLPRLVVPRTTSMQRAALLVWMTLALQLDPTIGGFAGSELGTPPEERVPPTELTRVSARAALSRLARADGRGVWFVTVPPDGLDRRWTKENPPMWSATQYDYGAADFVGRQIAARMPDIVPRDGPGSAAPRPRVGVTPFSPRKLKHVDPIYPSVTAARTEQTVVLELRIDQEGRVEGARILRSVPPFDQAALDAVRQWQYEPLLLNGLPTPFIVSVLVNFTPSSGGRGPAQPIPRPVR
jgi:TonB family protein